MIKWFEEAPLWLKIVFALPGIDIVWAIFRIVKGVTKKDYNLVLIGILWILLGWIALWVVDLVSIIIKKHPILA
jgi:hypothetical protein